MQFIKQSETTAVRRTILIGPLANTADDSAHTAAVSGADLRISKAGAAEANSAGTATHIANGLYSYVFTVGEADTLGAVSVRVAKTGVYGDIFVAQVIALDLYDAAAAGIGNLDVSVSTRLPTTTYEGADALLDKAAGVETGVTMRGALRLMLAVLAGKVSGAGTGTEIFRNAVDDSKARVTSVVDSSGNRTTVTTDQT
jgi:hypothetical protein